MVRVEITDLMGTINDWKERGGDRESGGGEELREEETWD